MEVTKEHKSIMEHTINNGLFCGDSQEMRELCSLKLMKPVGKKSFVPDHYFAITQEGKEYVNDCRELGVMSGMDEDVAALREVFGEGVEFGAASAQRKMGWGYSRTRRAIDTAVDLGFAEEIEGDSCVYYVF